MKYKGITNFLGEVVVPHDEFDDKVYFAIEEYIDVMLGREKETISKFSPNEMEEYMNDLDIEKDLEDILEDFHIDYCMKLYMKEDDYDFYTKNRRRYDSVAIEDFKHIYKNRMNEIVYG